MPLNEIVTHSRIYRNTELIALHPSQNGVYSNRIMPLQGGGFFFYLHFRKIVSLSQ